jgi:L-threonylcarbamoyladenylate synthase
MIFEVTGLHCQVSGKAIRVSGALENHYAPKAALRVNEKVASGAGFIALADVKTPEGLVRLASPQNLDEYARSFYESLRLADQKGISEILVVPPEGEGLAVAIRDRIEKARTKS